ncbi:MAG: hypothetical protein BKP49_02120 [Treponema sp. CETP13]|nr:MAG: hypothetical protein BKP49_02120 [Treponema sp. CETP13]
MNIVLFTLQDKTDNPLEYFLPQNDIRTKHILTILHKKVGDTFTAGIENGRAGIATIINTGTTDTPGLLCEFSPVSDGNPLFPIEMIIGFPRPIQLKRMFRDLASLGISKIHLCGTEFGEKSYLDSKIVERGTAHTLLKEGTIQAKSTHVPELYTYQSVQECLEKLHLLPALENFNSTNLRITLDNINASSSLSTFLHTQNSYTNTSDCIFAAIGSERGWTDKERNLFEKAGFTRCSMGNRVLRTETAATVAATVILENIFNII